MNQLGRSVYAMCETDGLNRVIETFNSYKPEIKVFKLKINDQKLE